MTAPKIAVDSVKHPKQSFRKKFFNSDNSPPEIFNKTLYLSVFVFGVLGCARGLDEGGISGSVAQASFKKQFGLSDESKTEHEIAQLKSNITSMVQLGSIGGSLLAMYLVDKFGRIKTLQGVCVGWIASVVIQITASKVGQLYAGRLLEGLAIGQTVVLGPTYLSEIAPKAIRGLCTCVFAGAVYMGIMLSYFSHYATAIHMSPSKRLQWVLPTSLKIIIAGLLFIGTWFCKESPRWLMKVGNINQAYKNLSKIRNLPEDHPYVLSEISDIQEQINEETEETKDTSMLGAFKELLFVPSVRYRLCLGLGVQILGQWSGANAITIYMPELTALVGYSGTRKLLMTAILGVVKFSSAYLCAFFIIDFLGRRKSLYIGLTIQTITTLFFALFIAIVPKVADEEFEMSPSEKQAGVAALAMLYLNGVGWTMGWNSIQYLINSEMFPLRVRNIGTATIMAFHFANQYGNTKAVPLMNIALHHKGTFFFFFAVLLMGLFFCWFFVPEISGRSIESMDRLFEQKWYLIGRYGAELAPDTSGVNHVRFVEDESGKGELKIDDDDKKHNEEFIENASSVGNLTKSQTQTTTTQTNITSNDSNSTNSQSNLELNNLDLEKGDAAGRNVH
ncbi:Galactose transporter [Wickerhamomyces ciferrii]|uniref:Galactose transporter n=1 Tax=Wickerhamomyces ciferrii (strain ATCC 14091 / BCRC 22168 / CBS 111 / JCM 3599 / NBRC 0793 / NRRL Y-1031 F-60-10) TaxID=1206466 RepID=K0KI88_WICCF|nr:Galactose transporter [Wickerhamomyces ciferrii]CCH41877.1 Galactose transporter [Wickerhamomyces ciferrii]